MIVYIDLVAFINFLFDGTLLMTTDLLLKRRTSIMRIVLGSLVGELSMLTLFFEFSKLGSTSLKILLSILMCLTAFGFKNLKYIFNNVLYLSLTGTILGGFVYYLYNEFQIGSEYSLKYLIILFLAPIALFVYYKLSLKLKNNYNNRKKLEFTYGNNSFSGTAFLDSGNKLVSPISGKPIILVEKEYIKYHKLKLIPVPYNALNHHGIVNCFKPDEIYIDGLEIKNVLIGISEVKFNIDGVNAILNARMEGI